MKSGRMCMLAVLLMAAPVAAWPTNYSYDGYTLLTNESGTLKGFVYMDKERRVVPGTLEHLQR
ncbi:MAG: hypothetical protein PHP59_03250 [Methanofollis sp.]|uniref:hypothetical protein n=1 Tax=Methanofollis sp. TaxID=2052835 RepID=UPI002631AB0B|nr:hypothetical protein [Methanofollis sp.]MDD4254372.1 hypothetical protein [Methanofollis sp.]